MFLSQVFTTLRKILVLNNRHAKGNLMKKLNQKTTICHVLNMQPIVQLDFVPRVQQGVGMVVVLATQDG